MVLDVKVKEIAATAALCATAFLCIEGGLLLREVRSSILPVINQQVTSTGQQASVTLKDYSRLAQDSVGVTGEIRRTLKASQDSYRQTTANSAKATALLTEDLQRFGALIDTSNATVGHLGDSTDAVIARLDPILGDLAHSSADLASQTPIILQNVSNTSRNAADGTAQLVLTAQDLHKMGDDTAEFIHRETRPVKGVYNTAKIGVDWLYKLKTIF